MPGKVRGLYKWCQKVTEGYEGLEITNMTSSWKNGLALCALINRFQPDLIDFYSLSPENVYYNNDLAFTVAEKEFDIPKFLDPEDMVTMEAPDRQSMATYVAEFYEHFKDKPMYDPPEMPPGWPSCVPLMPKPVIAFSREKENLISLNSALSENKNIENQTKEREDMEIQHLDKEIEVGDKENDDIDDLYKGSLELLETEKSEVTTFNQACKSEIQEIKTAKKGAVIQAIVCAGIAAVAATTVGDDTEHYDSSERKGEEGKVSDVKVLNTIENKKQKDEKVLCQNVEKLDTDETEVKSYEDGRICDTEKARPDLLRSDSGIGTANTEVLKETLLNVLQVKGQFENDPKIIEQSPEQQLMGDTKKTVDLLNDELNKGELEIVNVNVIETNSRDSSDSKCSSEDESLDQNDQESMASVGECATSSKHEENIACELKEYSNSRSSSLGSGSNIEESFASELVENIFNEVKSNPELIAEISKELPSIVNEVECELEMESENFISEAYITETSTETDTSMAGFQHAINSETLHKESSSSSSSDSDEEISKNKCESSDMNEDLEEDKPEVSLKEELDVEVAKPKKFQPQRQSHSSSSSSDTNTEEVVERALSHNNLECYSEVPAMPVKEDVTSSICIDVKDIHPVVCDPTAQNEKKLTDNETAENAEQFKLAKDTSLKSSSSSSSLEFNDEEEKTPEQCKTVVECSEQNKPLLHDTDEEEKSEKYQIEQTSEIKEELNEYKGDILEVKRHSKSSSSSASDDDSHFATSENDTSCVLPDISANTVENLSVSENDTEIHPDSIPISRSVNVKQMSESNLEAEIHKPEQHLFQQDAWNNEKGWVEIKPKRHSTSSSSSSDSNSETAEYNTTRVEIPDSEDNTDIKQMNEIEPVAVTTLNSEYSENAEKAGKYQSEKNTSVVNEDTNENERDNIEFEQRMYYQSSSSSSDSKDDSFTVALENKSFLESYVQETIPSKDIPTRRDKEGVPNVCVTTPQSEKRTAEAEFWQPKEQLLEQEETRTYQLDNDLPEQKTVYISSTSSASDSDTNDNLDTVPIDHNTVLNDLIQKHPESEAVNLDKKMNDSESEKVAVSVSAAQSLQNIPESERKTDVETFKESDELGQDLFWSEQRKHRQSTSTSSSTSDSDKDDNDVPPKEIALSSKTSAINEENAYFHTNSKILQPLDMHVRSDASKENLHDCTWKTDEDQLQTDDDSCEELSKSREKHQSSTTCESETDYVVPLDNKPASFKATEDVNDSSYADGNKPLDGSDSEVPNDEKLPADEKIEKEYQPVSTFPSSESRDEEGKSHKPVEALEKFNYLMLEHIQPPSCESSNQGFKQLSPPNHSVPSSSSDSDGEAPALPVEGPPKVLLQKTVSDTSDDEIRDELNLQTDVEVEKESTDREDTSEKNPPSEDIEKPKYFERKSSSSSSSSSTSSDDEDTSDKTTQDSQSPGSNITPMIEDKLLNEDKNLLIKELDVESGTKPETKDVDKPELLVVENEKPEVKEIINISTSSITRTEPEPMINEREDLKIAKLGVPGVKLEWSYSASDDKFETQRTSDVKQPDADEKVEKPADKPKLFADIDTDLMKKAAIMSRKMAQSITSKMEDQTKSHSGTLDKGDVLPKSEEKNVSPTEKPDLDERKARKLAMFRQLQFSTRPKMKRLDESDGSSDSDSGFRSKLQMFARKSSTNTDPDLHKFNHSLLPEVVPRKKISSPFLQSPSPTDEQKHLKKLHECLPENPAPGSVAEYIRKISEGTFSKPKYEESCPDYEEHLHGLMNSKTITEVQSADTEQIDKQTKIPAFKVDGKAQLEQKTKEISPSSVFAGRPIMRRHTMQDRKLPVRPMSIELKYEKEQEASCKENEKPPIPPPRLHRKKQEKLKVDIGPLEEKTVVLSIQPIISDSDLINSFKETSESNHIRRDSLKDKVDIEVKSLEKQPTLSDEEKQEEEKKNELKRQESLKRRQSPRRALSLSSPTRSDFTDKDGARVRNIWQDPAKKPPSPKVKRSNSFEIKVRPISHQLTPDEKEQRKKEKELERSNSFKSDSSSRPPTPTKNQQKVPVVVKPIFAQDTNENKQNIEDKLLDSRVSAKPLKTNISSENGIESDTSDSSKKSSSPMSKKPPRGKKKSSILSLIGSIAHPKSEGNGKPLIVDEIVVAKSVAIVETFSPIKTAVINSPQFQVSDKGCENEIPNIVADKVTDESSAKEEKKPLTKVEDALEKELDSAVSLVSEQTDTEKDKKRSKFKHEQEEVIRKCNSIFGLVKSRIKPSSNETVEGKVSAKANTLNFPESSVKVETIDVKSSPPESYGREELLLCSSSSSASISPEQKRKEIDTVTKSAVNLTMNTICDLGNSVEYPNRADTVNSEIDNASVSQECVESKDRKSRTSGSFSSETVDNVKDKRISSSASSPSSNSSAEIQKEELKEGLKSIIKDLENDMRNEEESPYSSFSKDEKGKGIDCEPDVSVNICEPDVSVNTGVTLKLDQIPNAASDYHSEDLGKKTTVEEEATIESKGQAINPMSQMLVSEDSVENEKLTSSTESSSEDDKKQITNEYKKLLNSKSIETQNDVGADKYVAQHTYKTSSEEEMGQSLKAGMEPDKKGRHLSSNSSSEETDLNGISKSNKTVDRQGDRPNSEEGIDLDATEFEVPEALCVTDKSSLEESGESEKKKKDRKRRKKKRHKSESSSSSESSHTDSDKDDENDDGKNSNNTTRDSSGNEYQRSENDNEDQNRKSSSGNDNSTQSGVSKEAHVLSIDIPGEGAVVLQNDMDSHSLKNRSLDYIEDKNYHADEEHSESDDEIIDIDDKYSNEETVLLVQLENINDTPKYRGQKNDINHLEDLSINKRTEDGVNDSGKIKVSKTIDAGTAGSKVEVIGTTGSLKSTSDSDSSQSSSSESSSDDSGSEGGASSDSNKLAVDIATRPAIIKELSGPRKTDRTSSSDKNLEKNLKDEPVQSCFSVSTKSMGVDNDKIVEKSDISGHDLVVVKDLPTCIEEPVQARIASIAESSQNQRKDSSSSNSSRISKSDPVVSSFEAKDVDERMNINVPSKNIKKERRSSSCSHTSEDSLSDSDVNFELGDILCENNTEKNIGDRFVDESLAQNFKSNDKVIAVESTCSVDHEDMRITVCPSSENSDIENDANAQDTFPEVVKEEKYKPHSFSRSDSSSSESGSNYVEKGESETEDDELLKSVIEDAEPFRAPLLEDVIKSASLESSELEENVQKQVIERIGVAESEHHRAENICEEEKRSEETEKSRSGSETDSSDDLYSDSKNGSEKDQYILPECNKISTDFDFIPKEDSYYLPDYGYKPVPVDVQVFVIPDGPIDKHFYPVLKDPEVLITDDNNKIKDVLDLNEEIIIPVEPVVVADVEDVSDKIHVDLSEEIEKSFDKKKNVDVSDIILEPVEGATTEHSESEDELLKNILLQNEMNLYSIEKRKSSTSSFSSADEINVRVKSKKEIDSDKEIDVTKTVSPVKEKENIEDNSVQIANVKHKDAQYENVFIFEKPDSVTDLCKSDVVICKKVSTDSEIGSFQGGVSVSRKSSESSSSSVNSDDIEINTKSERDNIYEDIEARSRCSSSSSSDSRSSKSEGTKDLEVSANVDSE